MIHYSDSLLYVSACNEAVIMQHVEIKNIKFTTVLFLRNLN